MRAARERVANSLPKPEDVKRESLAIVRDAVMAAMGPVVGKVAEVTRGIGIAFDPNPASFPVPVPEPYRAPAVPLRKPTRAPAVPQPSACSGPENGCKCFNCDPPF
jgi:hypothetical protein